MNRITIVAAAFAAAVSLATPALADPRKDESGHRGGPPSWAPAHGYRNKHDHHGHRDGHGAEIHVGADRPLVISNGKCNREAAGAVFGGIVGGVIGHHVSRDSNNRELGTLAGAIIGVVVGKRIGENMDRNDASCAAHALEHARDGEAVAWHNPDSDLHLRLTPTDTFDRDGRVCRHYRTEVVQGREQVRGSSEACRLPDGKWQFADGTPI